jgi:HEAT repeat protein
MMTLDLQMSRLTSGNRHERLAALRALKKLGTAAVPAVDLLIDALVDQDDAIRGHAAAALQSIGPGAAAAVEALKGALFDERISVRRCAALALVGIGNAAAPALDGLFLAAIANDDAGVHGAAVKALTCIDVGTISVQPLLERAMEEESARTRAKNGNYGEWAILNGILGDSKRDSHEKRKDRFHTRAVNALAASRVNVVPALIDLIDSKRVEARAVAAGALIRIAQARPKPFLRTALPALNRAVARERDRQVARQLRAAARTIEEVTADISDLPVPSEREDVDRHELPIPATGAPDDRSL